MMYIAHRDWASSFTQSLYIHAHRQRLGLASRYETTARRCGSIPIFREIEARKGALDIARPDETFEEERRPTECLASFLGAPSLAYLGP